MLIKQYYIDTLKMSGFFSGLYLYFHNQCPKTLQKPSDQHEHIKLLNLQLNVKTVKCQYIKNHKRSRSVCDTQTTPAIR